MKTICLLCGLPGAGKSTVLKSLRESQVPPEATVVTVLLDEILELVMEGEGGFSPEAWHRAQAVMKELVLLLVGGEGEPSRHAGGMLKRLSDEWKRAKEVLVIVEDNFYYKSMRSVYQKVAEQKGIGFCAVWMECGLETCLKRNQERQEGKVSEKVIRDMHKVMSSDDKGLTVFKSDKKTPAEMVADLLDCCHKASLHPLEDTSGIEEARLVHERSATAGSISHQLDLALRKATTTVLSNLNGSQKQTHGATIAGLRREVLRQSTVSGTGVGLISDVVECFQASAWAALRTDF